MTNNLNSALQFLSLPNACPLCVVALNPQTGQPIAVNSTFESILGPFYKFKEWEFSDAACEDDATNPGVAIVEEGNGSSSSDDRHEKRNRSKFREAINRVRTSLCDTNIDEPNADQSMEEVKRSGRVRNVQMLALGTNDAGLPIRKYFDWTIGSVQLNNDTNGNANGHAESGPDSAVILYGDMVNEVESTNRARDAELIDFFQNAPIAMHWLNGNGTVLWANQTELNVLGYSAEEYIGQPIMNFCPDEQELVLEIFKQLGSGNAIADVPVRFRTKDGKLVHLLIDSNVAYNPDGSFGHTRCFIRDDTARKIRDARTKLLLEENERSLRMLDNFLSRTLHHVMGPLHALRGTCEVVSDRLQLKDNIDDVDEREKNCELLEQAAKTVTTTTRMVADVSDLARFDEGATLRTKTEAIDLREAGSEAIEKLRFDALRLTGGDDGISVRLDLVGNGGPRAGNTDRAALLRVLAHLLENAVREVGKAGKVTLRMTSSSSNSINTVLVEILDDGKGLPAGTCLDQGGFIEGKDTRPAPCHRYLIGSGKNSGTSSNDPDELQKVRAEMEDGLRDLKQNGVGVGLPLSYHLVRVLGGDLRHERLDEGTRIWFVLPNVSNSGSNENNDMLMTETIFKKGLPPAQIAFPPDEKKPNQNKRRRVDDDAAFGNFSSDGSTTTTGDETTTTAPSRESSPLPLSITAEPTAPAVAKCGIKASMPFSVLIVEDTNICARLLAMQLKKMKCSTQRAENGQVAVNLLKDSLPGTFDMVLMDLRMPVMDGLEATKLIRNELKINDLPILALTGEMREDIRSECEGIGFTEFFQKPLPKKKLQELVAKYKAVRDGGE